MVGVYKLVLLLFCLQLSFVNNQGIERAGLVSASNAQGQKPKRYGFSFKRQKNKEESHVIPDNAESQTPSVNLRKNAQVVRQDATNYGDNRKSLPNLRQQTQVATEDGGVDNGRRKSFFSGRKSTMGRPPRRHAQAADLPRVNSEEQIENGLNCEKYTSTFKLEIAALNEPEFINYIKGVKCLFARALKETGIPAPYRMENPQLAPLRRFLFDYTRVADAIAKTFYSRTILKYLQSPWFFKANENFRINQNFVDLTVNNAIVTIEVKFDGLRQALLDSNLKLSRTLNFAAQDLVTAFAIRNIQVLIQKEAKEEDELKLTSNPMNKFTFKIPQLQSVTPETAF